MNDELREKKKGRKREVQLLIAWANPIHNRDIKLTYQFFFTRSPRSASLISELKLEWNILNLVDQVDAAVACCTCN